MKTFEKPVNVSYTDMCIYIDDNIYKEKHNVETVYKYLYLIIHMLSSNQQLLKSKYLDDFSLFAATKVYFRLTNPDQFIKNTQGEYKLSKVKSVLNYIKSSLYFLKVDFEQSEYFQDISQSLENVDLNFNFDNVISKSLSQMDLVDFELTMGDIPKTCEKFLSRIPYTRDNPMWHNIYVSTLMTFTSMCTLTYKQAKRISELSDTNHIKQYHYERFYSEESLKPILYHVPQSMGPYIIVLARQLKQIIGRDLSDIIKTKVDNDVTAVMMAGKDWAEEQEGLEYED